MPDPKPTTGAEHYREAGRLINIVLDGELLYTPDMRMRLAVIAQTHATLALAAANAMPALMSMCGDSDRITDWGDAIGWNTTPSTPAPLCSHPDCYLTDGHSGDHEKGFPF